MDKTNVIVGCSNVNGNISSCEIKSTDIPKSSWSYETIAVNSCTGQVVADFSRFGWGSATLSFGIVVLVLLMGVWAIESLFN